MADTVAATHPLPATAEPLTVLRGVLRERRRSLAGWATALGAVTLIYASFYPAIGGQEMTAMIDALPADLSAALGYDRMGSAGGYLTSTVYGLLGPVLLLVFAIGHAARTLAGNEEDGGLELELTAPVSRRAVAAQRFAALLVQLTLLVVVVTVVAGLLVAALDFEGLTALDLLPASLGMWLLAAALGAVAFAAGAVSGRRVVALAVGAGIAVAGYIAHALSGMTAGAAWLAHVSPFGWYLGSDPIVEGPSVAGYLALAALTLVATGIALTAFTRRDLMV